MGRITLADLASDEVELPGGHVYTIAAATRKFITKAKDIDERFEALDDDDADGIVGVYAELLTLRLDPVAKGQQHAGTVIKRMWESDQITLPQLRKLMADISETDRPT